MNTKKYIVFYIIFLIVIPSKIILGQDIDVDTAVQTELDIKYDSILAKGTSALTASAYQQAIEYYKEAGALKPAETYPYKMIKYVEDLAARQKRSDDLKRKAQIKTELVSANQAIADKNWGNARVLFKQILALQPEKADEEYAKAKIAAIDLELKRIALRAPVKEEPKPVILPKNRREARAMRKVAERNATLTTASDGAAAQKPAEAMKPSSAPLSSAKNNQKSFVAPTPGASAAPEKKVSYRILQRFNEDFKDPSSINWTVTPTFIKVNFLQDEEKVEAFYDPNGALLGTSRYISITQLPKEVRKIFATKYAQYNIKEVIRYEGAEEAAYYISTEDDKEKVVFRMTGSRDVSVFSRGLAEKNTAGVVVNPLKGTQTRPAEVPLAKTPAVVAPSTNVSAAPAAKSIQQKPTEVAPPATNIVTAAPSNKEIPRQPIQTLPDRKTGNDTSLNKVIPQNTTEALPAKNIAVAPSTNAIPKQRAEVTLPDRKNVPVTSSPQVIPQKTTEIPPAKNIAVTPATNTVPKQRAEVTLPDRRNIPVTSSPQVIPQKTTEIPPVKNIAVAPATNSVPKQPAEVTLPDRKNVTVTSSPQVIPQKTTEIPPAKNIAAAPSTNAIPKQPAEVSSGTKTTAAMPSDIVTPSTGETAPKSTETSLLNLSDSSDNVKMTCQDISFIGSNAYIKVLVQNYSATTDFLTDTLQVSIKKNNGTLKKLDQRFISNFPVVKPQNESVLVFFADALIAVAPDDTFILEMNDKTKKTRLVIQVPWSRYKQQKSL